jgi:hypothetical protein
MRRPRAPRRADERELSRSALTGYALPRMFRAARLCVLVLAAACNLAIGLDDYVFEGGAAEGAGGVGGEPSAGGAGGAPSGGGGALGGGGAAPLTPPQPIPDSATEHCIDGQMVSPPPVVGAASFGQDCSYPDSPPHMLTVGAEVLSDDVTGLSWQLVGTTMDGALAAGHCADETTGGLSPGSWRVPTLYELTTLLDVGLTTPFLDLEVFTLPRDLVWTQSPADGGGTFAVGDGSFSCDPPSEPGASACDAMGVTATALCVTGTTPPRSFVPGSSAATVIDDRSLLEWQVDAALTNQTWLQALQTCEALTLAGHDDWRLPSVKELTSLLDPTGEPLLHLTSLNERTWTSTPRNQTDGDGNEAFAVTFGVGGYSSILTGEAARARCVRGPVTELP